MRLAIYIDGANFYQGLQRMLPGVELDYAALGRWLTARVGGDEATLVGARYYAAGEDPQLLGFLDHLQGIQGYLLRRGRLAEAERSCPQCGHAWLERREKAVDTAIVADLVLHASQGSFDRAVLLSGDEDLLPGVRAAHELGRPVWVATWAGRGLGEELRGEAFESIDLMEGVASFSTGRLREHSVREGDDGVLEQIEQGVRYFGARGGHLGRWYFEHRWSARGPCAEPGAERVEAVARLIAAGRVQAYTTDLRGREVEAIRPV